jgi:hypothetical protein
MSDLDTVARAIYHVFSQPFGGKKPWFDQLPLDAKDFLRDQAKAGLERLRDQVSDEAIADGQLVCDAGSWRTQEPTPDARKVFQAIMDRVIAGEVNDESARVPDWYNGLCGVRSRDSSGVEPDESEASWLCCRPIDQ